MPRADSRQQVRRRADPHEITGPFRRQPRRRFADDFTHHLRRFADGKATDGIAVKTDIDQRARAFFAQALIVAALHDAEQRPAGTCPFERALAAFGPAQRQAHGALDLGPLGGKRYAFVELHGDIGAEQVLHLDGPFRRQFHHGAVDVRAERHACLRHFAQGRQRHHLKSAGIGQDRMGPAHEGVQSAQSRDAFGARPQHQMIGIAENDIGARGTHVVVINAFDRRLRADRHESGRAHHAMRHGHRAGARGAVRCGQMECEWFPRHGVIGTFTGQGHIIKIAPN